MLTYWSLQYILKKIFLLSHLHHRSQEFQTSPALLQAAVLWFECGSQSDGWYRQTHHNAASVPSLGNVCMYVCMYVCVHVCVCVVMLVVCECEREEGKWRERRWEGGKEGEREREN